MVGRWALAANIGLVLCLHLLLWEVEVASAAKRVHIPDQLDDVVDNEEDEAWKAWGKPKPKPIVFDPPPDFDGKDLEKYQLEMLKRQTGPSMGFVKLRLGVSRKPEEASMIARKWSELLKTGSIAAKIYAVDKNTIMFAIENGQDTLEVKDFVLSQSEAYEFKLGNNAFRRPGDPPLEVVVERLRSQEANKKAQSAEADKEEL